MSDNLNINSRPAEELVAPTPQNTPLQNQPLTREALSRPTVGTVQEEEDEEAAAANAPDEAAAAAIASNPALAAMVAERLGRLNGASSGYVEGLPSYLRRRVAALEGLQAQHLKIEAEFQKEIMELERKFQSKYAPLYQQRKDIILGSQEPSAALVLEGEKATEAKTGGDGEDEGEEKKESLAELKAPADGEKGVPQFWLTALRTHTALAEIITDRDEAALKTLQDIRSEHLPSTGKPGFMLFFDFAADNGFFTNKTLTKTYYYRDDVGPNGDLIYDHAEGTPIEWVSADEDLTKRVETKKQRNKHTNETRVVKRSVPTESFFNFFQPPQPPSGADNESDDEGLEELEERLELDYQLGEDLKDRIVPHAIAYFTGEALNYEEFDELDGFEDEDDEDEDDDDDEDGPAPGGATAQSADPAECRQQ